MKLGGMLVAGTVLAAFAAGALAQAQPQSPETGAHLPSQAAADVLRGYASTDGAFLAAGLVREGGQRDNLASYLQYPTDELVILKLNGRDLRQAFERSVSLYPQPNSSFLQLSGFEVTFSKAAAPGARVLSATAGGVPLDSQRIYTIAMPSSLGRGGLGYFKIWDKDKISKTFEGVTIEAVLKGKAYVETSPRWVVQG